MAKYLVQKSNPLSGEVEISGAKNAVLPIMAAALLSEEECTLFDVPALRDVDVLTQLLTHIGAVVKKADTNTLNIYTPNINTYEAPFELVKKMRASFLVAGPSACKNRTRKSIYAGRLHNRSKTGGASSQGLSGYGCRNNKQRNRILCGDVLRQTAGSVYIS